jgi:hypothetical protein
MPGGKTIGILDRFPEKAVVFSQSFQQNQRKLVGRGGETPNIFHVVEPTTVLNRLKK